MPISLVRILTARDSDVAFSPCGPSLCNDMMSQASSVNVSNSFLVLIVHRKNGFGAGKLKTPDPGQTCICHIET